MHFIQGSTLTPPPKLSFPGKLLLVFKIFKFLASTCFQDERLNSVYSKHGCPTAVLVLTTYDVGKSKGGVQVWYDCKIGFVQKNCCLTMFSAPLLIILCYDFMPIEAVLKILVGMRSIIPENLGSIHPAVFERFLE